MTATVTDLFCGAGGSSLGAEAAGMQLVMAANHWQTAIEVHQSHFPEADHDQADISQADPRRYPRTDILLASPECTHHSQARGVSRKKWNPDDADPTAERSRATMWDVVRFAEQIDYEAIVVENVVEAMKWGPNGNGAMWRAWCMAIDCLGYERTILSHNSMHHGVPQSRDRIYIVLTKPGLNPDLEMEATAHCPFCERQVSARQTWKPLAVKRQVLVGRYRRQWTWNCTRCAGAVEPTTTGAAEIIDWSLDCPRIGDRPTNRALAHNTRARILAGLQRYGWAPIITAGAGNTFERRPGNRARPLTDPLAVQQTSATHALATPPEAFIVRNYGNKGGDPGRHVTPIHEPTRTMTTEHGQSLLIPMRNNGNAYPPTEPIGAVTAGGNHHGLLMRNNGGLAEMVTPLEEPARTMTTKGHQSLLMPYYGNGRAQPATIPAMTMRTNDTAALIDTAQVVDDCGFRMLEPHEVAAAMAFPLDYIPRNLTKKAQVKLAGNAVTPPVMQWICGRLLQALEAR